MIFLKNNFKIFIVLSIILSGCVSLPGIINNPSNKSSNSKIISSDYSIDDVGINIIKINSLSDVELNKFNKDKIDEYLIFVASEKQVNWLENYSQIQRLKAQISKTNTLMEKHISGYILIK